ncbi:hypothetical protein SD70_31880 [Gordoniibacillus kamchatkensis]|uniref:Uncharacterized protein n=1 Tax=Gordoniibacillus kamchatkensis TaxID=1590651 RepID=A0ABR5A6Q0_9BACL|nr:hypothetical protein [Paenibacillus sp. VKM B-2647]KIL36087.1 hypothetical protein SD70_31880 [Paenibacillus sp. VKM B-2647]
MNVALAIFGGLLGLAVTAAAVYTVWIVKQYGKERGASPEERYAWMAKLFLNWTALDVAVVALFVCGTLLLLADVFGVMRDRSSYPLYHYGYLLSGVTFSIMGMLFVLIRLAVVLRTERACAEAKQRADRLTNGGGGAAPHEHGEP